MNALKMTAAAAALCSVPLTLSAEGGKNEPWGLIDARTVEVLVDARVPLNLVDARTDKYFDGTVLPGAKRLPTDASETVIAEILPEKTKLVVVYCGGEKCPASKQLAGRLYAMGYPYILDYHGGISDWKNSGRSVQSIPAK